MNTLTPPLQQTLRRWFERAADHGCPRDQVSNFYRAGILLESRQLVASAAARLCDQPDGPTAIGYGGARGGGKTHWLLAQLGADDCQRLPGLSCLLLRKVGKSNLENFENLRRRLFQQLPHDFNASRKLLVFANGSRITLGHYQCEKDIDSYLGLEYDVIGIEEATQLTQRKYEDISTCCRTSKPGWRPRIYSTTNPGGIGHQWYLEKFIVPHQCGTETTTRFIPARVEDNSFINADYKLSLATRTGWQRDAWYLGRWNFAAGQFFRNFRPEIHVITDPPPKNAPNAVPSTPAANPSPLDVERSALDVRCSASDVGRSKLDVGRSSLDVGRSSLDVGRSSLDVGRSALDVGRSPAFRPPYFHPSLAVEWFASMDYGYTHRNVVLLACRDHADNIYVVDEHAERYWIPERHAAAVKAMLARHGVYFSKDHLRESLLAQFPDHSREREHLWYCGLKRMLDRFVTGADAFSNESHGISIAEQYRQFGVRLMAANTDRQLGWSLILQRLGDIDTGIKPTLFIHHRCKRLIECLPYLQHDPDRPGDVLKSNVNEEGAGGDDAADALRYLLASKPAPRFVVRPLLGL